MQRVKNSRFYLPRYDCTDESGEAGQQLGNTICTRQDQGVEMDKESFDQRRRQNEIRVLIEL